MNKSSQSLNHPTRRWSTVAHYLYGKLEFRRAALKHSPPVCTTVQTLTTFYFLTARKHGTAVCRWWMTLIFLKRARTVWKWGQRTKIHITQFSFFHMACFNHMKPMCKDPFTFRDIQADSQLLGQQDVWYNSNRWCSTCSGEYKQKHSFWARDEQHEAKNNFIRKTCFSEQSCDSTKMSQRRSCCYNWTSVMEAAHKIGWTIMMRGTKYLV